MRQKRFVSPAEWEILQFITARHPITAREVAEHFASSHEWARNTVITMIERLRDKGYLVRDESANVHKYAPAAANNDMMQGLVRDFVHSALGGSVSPFVAYLSKEGTLSPDEVATLKQLVRELDAPEEQGGA